MIKSHRKIFRILELKGSLNNAKALYILCELCHVAQNSDECHLVVYYVLVFVECNFNSLRRWFIADCYLRLSQQCPKTIKKGLACLANPLSYLVGRQGFEPWTNGLKVRCSTS
jgi:hypothetical protein